MYISWIFGLFVVNEWLAKGLGEGEMAPIQPHSEVMIGQEGAGQGRLLTFTQPIRLSDLIDRVKKHLKLERCRFFLRIRDI